MDHRQNRLEIAKCLSALVALTVPLPKQLRPYQMETIVSMIRWLEDLKGSRRAYVSHATGLGKTTLFASMITACAGLRVLVVVPSKVLVEQTVRELYAFTGGMIGHVSSLSKIKDADGEVIAMKGHDLFDVVVITDASLGRHGRKLAQEFDPHLVVRDECHWTYAEKRQKVMDFYPESVTIGFSATPDYLTNQAKPDFIPVTLDNGQVLYAPQDRVAQYHYGTRLDERTVRWGIEEGFLAPLAWGHVEFDFSLNDLKTEDGIDGPDYSEGDLQALLTEKWQFMQETIVELYKSGQYGLGDRQVFAVCHNVEAADRMSDALRGIGVRSACITGKTRDIERNAILSAFRSGEIKFLSSVMVLREGWNAPNAEVCLMLRPTRSRVFYVQSMGRVLRPSEDGSPKVALVVDAFFQNTSFAPLSAPVLFGHPGQEIGDGDYLIKLGDADRVKESPYKTGIVKPRLVRVEAIGIEHWADRQGILMHQDARYRSVNGFVKEADISESILRARLKECGGEPHFARNHRGHLTEFYPEELLQSLAKDLTSVELRVGPDGFLLFENVRYGTEDVILKEIGLTSKAIAARRDESKVRSITAKDRSGRPAKLFAIEDIKALCADLIERAQVGPDGVLRQGGICYATIETILARIGDVSKGSIGKQALKRFRSLEGRDVGGRKRTLYAVEDVEVYLGPLLSKPVADDSGLVEADGLIYGTKKSIAEALKVQRDLVSRVIKLYEIRTIQARSRRGAIDTFYSLSDVKTQIVNTSTR